MEDLKREKATPDAMSIGGSHSQTEEKVKPEPEPEPQRPPPQPAQDIKQEADLWPVPDLN